MKVLPFFWDPAGGPGAAATRMLMKLCRAEIKFLSEKLAQKSIFFEENILKFHQNLMKNLNF